MGAKLRETKMTTKFYMTYARSRPGSIVPYAEKHSVPLMSNAAHRWSEAKEELLDPWGYDTDHIIDSGGYNVQSNYGGYPWSVKDYHIWLSLNRDKFKWAACMDYACEERFDELHSVTERMTKTLDNTIEHFNYSPDYNLIPVLQGREIHQWVSFYDDLVDHGIPVDKVGLGTVCRVSSSKEIVNIERKIRENCKKIGHIHGFGVKLESFRLGATFDSADSQAWVYPASNGKMFNPDGPDIPVPDDSKKRTVRSFINYYNHVQRVILAGEKLRNDPHVYTS